MDIAKRRMRKGMANPTIIFIVFRFIIKILVIIIISTFMVLKLAS